MTTCEHCQEDLAIHVGFNYATNQCLVTGTDLRPLADKHLRGFGDDWRPVDSESVEGKKPCDD